MVILSAVTAFAFSYKDFRETQKQNWLLEKQGMRDLAKKLVNDVITDNFVTALEDLKDLKNPLTDPFRSYKPSEVKTDCVSVGIIEDSGESGSSLNNIKDFNAVVHERPFIIPEFMKKTEGVNSDNEPVISNTAFKSQEH